MKKQRSKNYFLPIVTLLLSLASFQVLAEDELITGRLTNGLTYYILKNKKPENRASLNLAVKSGSISESEEQRGLAHFLEHMAFNGTNLYPKNELVKYLQSTGLTFGGDLNAHTGYNETVYKLKIPSDSERSLEEGFTVLREWATEITLEEAAIEGEKNIILEEWRGRQGLSERFGKIRREALFGNSKYNFRNPIGVPETIQGANQKLLRDYYETWYNPNLMAVIAVGDFNVETVEKLIREKFSFKEKIGFRSPENPPLSPVKKDIITFSDPELTSSTIDLFAAIPYVPSDSEKNILENLKLSIFTNLLNSRLSLLAKKGDTDFRNAAYYSYPMGNGTAVEGIQISAKENRMEEALEEVLTVLKSLAQHLPKESELNRELNAVSVYLKDRMINRDSIENEDFISELRDQFMFGELYLSPKKSYELYEKLKSQITPQDISQLAQRIYGEDRVLIAAYPDKAGEKKYSRENFEKVISAVASHSSDAFASGDDLEFTPVKLSPGKIISEEHKKDFILYTLSNGIKVYYKETDFQKDKINITLFKEEGSSSLGIQGYLNSLLAARMLSKSGVGKLDMEAYELFLKDKNFSLEAFIDDYEHGFRISTDSENLKRAMETFSTMIEDKKIDRDLLSKSLQNMREKIINLPNSPRAVYREKLNSLISGENIRRKTPTLNDLDKIDHSGIKRVYDSLFSNFRGYNAVIVGSIPKKEMENILVDYISALPVSSKNSSWKQLALKFPKGKTREVVTMGEDEKAAVTIVYPYLGNYSNGNRILFKAYSDILNIILIDKIREEMSGVYSIGSSGSLRYENHGENRLVIRFSANPENIDKISERVHELVSSTAEGEGIEKALKDIKESYRLSYNTELLKNDFWSAYLKNSSYNNKDYGVPTPEEFNSMVTEKNLTDFMKKAIRGENYAEIILVPEIQQSKK